MAFKSDSIRLKNYTATTDVAGPAQGELAVASNVLHYYNGSAWSAVDSSFTNLNIVKHTAWNAAIEISSGSTIASLVLLNTTSQGNTHALTLPGVSTYAAHAQIMIINGSDDDMVVTKKSSTSNFNWQGGGGSVSTVDIGKGQKAMFLKSGSIWEVVVMSL